MDAVMKTIRLKIHEPSSRKRQVLETAMTRYLHALSRMLRDAAERTDEIASSLEKGGMSRLNTIRFMTPEYLGALNELRVQPFKDALVYEVSMLLLTWYKRSGSGREGFPSIRGRSNHPLFFNRYDEKRGFCLLYDYNRNRWYARLQLLPSGDPLRAKKTGEKRCDFDVVGFERPPEAGNGCGAILVPLSFGKVQLGILEQARTRPGMIRTAKLCRRGNAFFLDISVAVPMPETLEIRSEMGIVRSLDGAVHMTVTNLDGQVIETRMIQMPSDGAHGDEPLHMLANQIVSMAVKHRARVVLQSFRKASDKLSSTDRETGRWNRPVLAVSAYNRLGSLLRYKLALKGLGPPIRISTNHLFRLCGVCGEKKTTPLPDSRLVMCTRCGSVSDPMYNGGRQILARLARYRAGAGGGTFQAIPAGQPGEARIQA